MKALKNPATLSLLILLQACSSSDNVAIESAPSPEASLNKPDSVVAQPFLLSGTAVVGHETQYLTPCGSNQQYWLQLSAQQRQQVMSLNQTPYQTLYGEFIGHLESTTAEGFAAEYDARFVVEQINYVDATRQQQCDQAKRPTRAFGNQPDWSLSFNRDNLTFTQAGTPTRVLDIERSQLSPRKRDYQLSSGRLLLTENLCRDAKNNALYGWKATLTQDKTIFNGCATTSNVDATASWSGLYTATSTQSAGFSVHLELKADHSAQTRYLYADQERPLLEHGYWQQLNPNQIQVVMTRHQGQKLVTERIFTRTGSQLKAEQEKVGSVVYPIAQGGLVLYPAKVSSNIAVEPDTEQPVALPSSGDINASADYNAKVDSAVREYFRLHKTEPKNNQYRWLTYDLNGDGQPELLTQLDWCGSGGCTLLIFENHADQWRFNSRITLVRSPIYLGTQRSSGWQDLIFEVSGGGAASGKHRMQYNGLSYPLNPSLAPEASAAQISGVKLFADGISPVRDGVRL
ncbi:membrane protein [Vibrio navarrensis]|uniref:Membrane protein n=1 Tax=Vibrio navarrensis TaxID=29495 RepID=A0A099LQS5_9VIBR|nr:membrane protein [Vibrio navarrensis]KGK09831.1 membrane protein [Vibrio navarrensis]MBE4616349.1 hypothetical protein [Vibrio navarrensis]QOD70171.1 hypothetical protein IF132_15800 [Vibrio navarrensis]